MRDFLIKFVSYLIIFLLIFTAVLFDVYRWKSFQKETGSDVGYLKWTIVIDKK